MSRQRVAWHHFPGHIIPPLIVWLLKRGDSPEIDVHGKGAVNFQLSMLIYNLVAGIFCLVLVAFSSPSSGS